MLNIRILLAAGVLFSGVWSLMGCDDDEPRTAREQPRLVTADDMSPRIIVHASRDHILVNESVTLFAETRNTLGGNPKLTWDTTLGKVEPQSAGTFRGYKPTAMFSSDKPGTAVVTATLKLDDQTLTDRVNITIDAAGAAP